MQPIATALVISTILISSLVSSSAALAEAVIELLPSKAGVTALDRDALYDDLASRFDLASYRQVRVQEIAAFGAEPRHLLVYLHTKDAHGAELAAIAIGDNNTLLLTEYPHTPSAGDRAAQVGSSAVSAQCPDPNTEFLAFAPNSDALEQSVTSDVIKAAQGSMHTVGLLLGKATRQAYLDYMTCPKLRGNFYDGDADTTWISTVDGFITVEDFLGLASGVFRAKVTNIWLACLAYNDPILSAVSGYDASRKYAAGINNLMIGPSDRAAACAMKAAIAGKPMTAAFQSCYQTFDSSVDRWGFGGGGSDHFWD